MGPFVGERGRGREIDREEEGERERRAVGLSAAGLHTTGSQERDRREGE